jgi:hypothetical protein
MKMLGTIIAIAGAIFVFWCTQVLVSPNFWATIPISNKYIGILKIVAAIVTFIILKAMTSGSKN